MIAELTNRITSALAERHVIVRDQNRLRWEVQPAGHAVNYRVSEDWLLLEAPLAASACAASVAEMFMPDQLVRWNATLPGGAKFGVDAQFNLTVRAEVPLIEDIDPGPRALEAVNGVLAGMKRFTCGCLPNGLGSTGHWPVPSGDSPDGMAAPLTHQMGSVSSTGATSVIPVGDPPTGMGGSPVPPLASVDLKALAAESGWAFNERDDGRITFELPSPAGIMTATLHTREDGAVRVWVSLAELAGLSTASRQALAVLLLRAGAVLRLARPAFVTDGGGDAPSPEVDAAPRRTDTTSACLEVVFASAPIAAELVQALESLAVGVALMAAEAKFLCQQQIALEYSRCGNWIPQGTGDDNNEQ